MHQRFRFIAAIVGFVILANLAAGQAVYVPKQFPTIQKALDAAQTGTTIFVDPGNYVENLVWPTRDGIRLIAAEGPDLTTITALNASPAVTIPAGLSRATLLQGFTITGVKSPAKAGVYVESSPTIRFNVIRDNWTAEKGGGVFLAGGGSALLDRNVIRDNHTCVWGGGIFVWGGASPVIRGNQILNNECQCWLNVLGGGLHVWRDAGPNILIANNVFAGNHISGRPLQDEGHAVALWGGSGDFINNTVVDSGLALAQNFGSAVFLGDAAAPSYRLFNNIIARNRCPGLKNVINQPTLILDFNNVWNNVTDYVNVTPGVHDRSLDPMFVGPGDYHLASDSPMIDNGANLLTVHRSALDIDGDPRFAASRLPATEAVCDVGADEYNPAHLGVAGSPEPGKTLAFEVTGPTFNAPVGPVGAFYVVGWSAQPANILVDPFGQQLISAPTLIGAGWTTGRVVAQIPAVPALAGSELYAQGFVSDSVGPGVSGVFTNRVDLTVAVRRPAIREDFSTRLFRDGADTTAAWGVTGRSGLFAGFGYGGDGSDGKLGVYGTLTLDTSYRTPGPDGVVEWNFTSLYVAPKARLVITGAFPARLNVLGHAVIDGTIDLSGQNGLSAPAGKASQVGKLAGGTGGPGGGSGGDANTNPLHPIGSLPMELRGGPGWPRATMCGDPNRSANRLVTVIEPNCGGGTGGNRGVPSGTLLRCGCSGNGGGHAGSGGQTDYLCSNIGAFGREFGISWIVPNGPTEVTAPTAGAAGGAGGNAALSTSNPIPADDIVAGAGGGGGGGLEIVAVEGLSVSGSILANGGNGGQGWSTLVGTTTVAGGWGAGGAGGSIWLTSTSVTVHSSAILSALGGVGNPNPPTPPRTGDGGLGYIIIRDRGGNPTVQAQNLTPSPLAGRNLFNPADNGVSRAVSEFYDSGSASPQWDFDANDIQTGEVKAGNDLVFLNPPVAGQKVFIAFQGAPDLGGKPNPNPSTWYPQNGFEPDIAKLKSFGGLRHLRYRLVINLGPRDKGQPTQNQVAIKALTIRY